MTAKASAIIKNNSIGAASKWVTYGLCVVTFFLMPFFVGCNRARSPLDEPMRYKTFEKLRGRLEQVSKYGDGGSSLGGIPESIEELTKSDPEKGKKLLESFRRLNTVDDKDARKKIAREMVEQLK